MKPKPTLPKGRVMYGYDNLTGCMHAFPGEKGTSPVAVIPCTSTKQARAILKLHTTPREELVRRVAKAIIEEREKRDSWSLLSWAEAAVKEILP